MSVTRSIIYFIYLKGRNLKYFIMIKQGYGLLHQKIIALNTSPIFMVIISIILEVRLHRSIVIINGKVIAPQSLKHTSRITTFEDFIQDINYGVKQSITFFNYIKNLKKIKDFFLYIFKSNNCCKKKKKLDYN